MDFSLGETQGRRFRARFRFLRFSQNASLDVPCKDGRDLGAARNSPESTICFYSLTILSLFKITFLLRKVIFVPFHCGSGTGPINFEKGWSQVAPEGLISLTRGIPGGGLPLTGAAAPEGGGGAVPLPRGRVPVRGRPWEPPVTFWQAKGGRGGEGVSGPISSPAPSSS